jgi:hypothetical protein
MRSRGGLAKLAPNAHTSATIRGAKRACVLLEFQLKDMFLSKFKRHFGGCPPRSVDSRFFST